MAQPRFGEAIPPAVGAPSFQAAPVPDAGPATGQLPATPGMGVYDAPGSSDVSDALSASDDGLPGGPTPASSGFSWRLPGSPAPVMHSQGGIPNEFDHLFRDSDLDHRRSLLPSQGPIGVNIPPASNRQSALPPAPARAALPPSSNADPQLPVYQAPGQAEDEAGYPEQPYLGRTYQQAVYQTAAQVPVGSPAGGDDHNTQAIPRVPVQSYGGGANSPGPDLLTGVPRRNNSTPVLLIAVGVFVVLVVVAAVAFSGGGSSSSDKTKKPQTGVSADTPAPSASDVKGQAAALFAVIGQSNGLVKQANGAITDVESCRNVAQAQAAFTDIAAKRQAQADGVKKLAVDQIPGGAALVADMSKAWQFSADSEREYAAWAADNASCSGKPGANDNKAKATSDGSHAGSAKGTVVSEWNALVPKTGQPTIAVGDL